MTFGEMRDKMQEHFKEMTKDMINGVDEFKVK